MSDQPGLTTPLDEARQALWRALASMGAAIDALDRLALEAERAEARYDPTDSELEMALDAVLTRYGIPADLGPSPAPIRQGGDRGDLTSDLAAVARDRIRQAVIAAVREQ